MKMKIAKFALLAALSFGAPSISPAMAESNAQTPNINGVWRNYTKKFTNDDFFGEYVVPNGGPKLKEPYSTQWKAFRAEREAKLKAGTPLVDSSTLCLPEGMPAVMYAPFPLQILQTPGQVTVLAEFLTQTRRIYLDVPMPAPDDNAPSYYGFSTGHWEGDTLVVTTKGVREDVTFFDIPHSDEMTITERIKLNGPDLLEDQITIDDPKRLLEPYQFAFGYKRNDDYRMTEYFCDRENSLTTVNKDGTVTMKLDQGEE
ncbi:hypothetical protein [Sphingobium sp. CECT 9361]|uniref:hypothetical protein n=1 Tax=Sphingobium sp. CECT 9361 TaxID=2845384 RepID=UPI001E58959A|nr:hypothetical protein [Sphingobium sp. CECT 9361]CAH0353835.1 hypothetical protein SPH9361_02690 [Sphingobium sp. CECT 9361]